MLAFFVVIWYYEKKIEAQYLIVPDAWFAAKCIRERRYCRSVHFCRRMYAGLVQNMYQTVTESGELS